MRATNRLTAGFLKSPPVGKHCDGRGLWLVVREDGGAQWVLRQTVHGRRREMGLGGVDTLSLSEAREKCAEHRKLLKQGIDPIAHRDAQQAAEDAAKEEAKLRQSQEERESITFKQCADEFIAKKEAEWGNAKHRQQWRNGDRFGEPQGGGRRRKRCGHHCQGLRA